MKKLKATTINNINKKTINNLKDNILKYLKDIFYLKIKDIYKEIFKKNIKYNGIDSELLKAIKKNDVKIEKNIISGKFNSKLVNYIKKELKGKYKNKKFEVEFIPEDVKRYLENQKILSKLFLSSVTSLITDFKYSLDYSINKELNINYNDIIEETDNNIDNNIDNPANIDYKKEEFNNNYINNTKETIKKIQEDNINNFLKQDFNNSFEIKEYVENNYHNTYKKVNSIIDNSIFNLISIYSATKYIESGIYNYIWLSKRDDRVRKRHRELDGKVFDFRNPPIIKERNNRTGNPGEDWGCRCIAVPIV